MCRKGGRTSDSDIEKSDSNSDSDSDSYSNSEDDDIEGFDGFADETDIDTIPRVEVLQMYGLVVH